MVKYSYAERVVKKLRRLLSKDTRLGSFLDSTPQVFLDASYNLSHLMWVDNVQRIVVNRNSVLYDTTSGVHETLLQFDGFDSLLTMR